MSAEALEAINGAMTTAFSTVQDNVISMVTSALPFALAIVGTVLAITIGVGVFKKITAKA